MKTTAPTWQERFAALVCAASARAHARMMRAGGIERLYLAYRPAERGAWGDFEILGESDTLPGGWEYVTPQHLPTHLTAEQLLSHVMPLCRRCPVIAA